MLLTGVNTEERGKGGGGGKEEEEEEAISEMGQFSCRYVSVLSGAVSS